jgi:hypothetical protein
VRVCCYLWTGFDSVEVVFLCGELGMSVSLGNGGGGGGFNGWRVFKRMSKILLGNKVWSSFKWLLAVNSACMW